MRKGGRDIPGSRNDLSKGKEVGEHKDGLRAGHRLPGPEPTRRGCWRREMARSVFQQDLCGEVSWAE